MQRDATESSASEPVHDGTGDIAQRHAVCVRRLTARRGVMERVELSVGV
jgi:hypothetical protein